MFPKISIVVPVYNVENYIRNCIESIMAQTYKEFELILVNDGSPDNSGKICEEYAKKDDRVKVIHKNNGGVSSARNCGIETAKGEYIAFVDPDDEVEPEMYELLLKRAEVCNADMVVCQIKTINLVNNHTSISPVYKESTTLSKKMIEKNIIPSILKNEFYSLRSGSNKLYRKNIIDSIGLRFDEKMNYGEDMRFNFLLLTNIDCLAFLERPLYTYYIRKRQSLTRVFREDFYQYIHENMMFRISLCQRYKLEYLMEVVIIDFISTTINYMEKVINSENSLTLKYRIIENIMVDKEFTKHIKDYKAPSLFYMILKKISILKAKRTFHNAVKMKYLLKKTRNGIVQITR
ncbi:glycosyl transferase family protein [Bacillus freudenreichii]|nr:glycosyl transferase family protein [Bacillus freudenreichii]